MPLVLWSVHDAIYTPPGINRESLFFSVLIDKDDVKRACCLTFTPPKQVVVWYGTQTGGTQNRPRKGEIISNVAWQRDRPGASRPGNLQQSPQMIPSGYQQGVQLQYLPRIISISTQQTNGAFRTDPSNSHPQ
ncbi:hypothetical protein OSTOST_14797 [Ostertagia ostertagi]